MIITAASLLALRQGLKGPFSGNRTKPGNEASLTPHSRTAHMQPHKPHWSLPQRSAGVLGSNLVMKTPELPTSLGLSTPPATPNPRPPTSPRGEIQHRNTYA